MEFLEKEKELRRLQIEKEPTIASAEESAIKRILEKERLLGEKGVTSDEGVRHELKPDVRSKTLKKREALSTHTLLRSALEAILCQLLSPRYRSLQLRRISRIVASIQLLSR